MSRTLFIVSIIALAPLTALSQSSYPERPVRFVVPYPPAGGSDVVGRAIAPSLSGALGKQIIIDNRPGGGGIIGSELVAKANPDGYTLLLTTQGPITINPSLIANMPYDPIRDFAPISVLASYGTVLVTHPSLPVHSVKELVAFAKAHPGALLYSSGGIGTTQHLAGELMKVMTGADIVHVPYKGGAAAFTDFLGGHVSMEFASPGQVLPFANSGKLRMLAVTSAKRSAAFPKLPTLAETLPGFECVAWIGLFAPAATPKAIVSRIHREVVQILQMPDIRNSLAVQNFEVVGNTPAEFAEYVKADLSRWSSIIRKANIKGQ